MISESYRQARVLTDRAVLLTKSIRERHSLRFQTVAREHLDELAWVASQVLGLCADPRDFIDAVAKAVADHPFERSEQDRLRTIHDVMRTLGATFS